MSDFSSTSLQALAGSFVGLATISVGMRFVARRKSGVRLWVDDWLILLAMVAFLGVIGGVFQWTSMSHSMPPNEPTPGPTPSELLVIMTFLTIFCLGCTKESACLLYRRIFIVQVYERSAVNTLINLSIVVIALWIVAFMVLFGTSCDGSLSKLMELDANGPVCTRGWPNMLAIGISDVVLDVWVLTLPMLPVFRLHTSLARKFSIAGVFLLGALALSASIARVVVSIQFYNRGTANITAEEAAKELSKCFFFLTFECGISIIAINLPIIGPLVTHSNYSMLTSAARRFKSLVSSGSESLKNSSKVDQDRSLTDSSKSSMTFRPVFDASAANEAYAVRHFNLPKAAWLNEAHDVDRIYVHGTVEVSSRQRLSDEEQELRYQ